ncbi:hypothetical protein BIW11_08725, partial [Tropilaelaps mercedesae]
RLELREETHFYGSECSHGGIRAVQDHTLQSLSFQRRNCPTVIQRLEQLASTDLIKLMLKSSRMHISEAPPSTLMPCASSVGANIWQDRETMGTTNSQFKIMTHIRKRHVQRNT